MRELLGILFTRDTTKCKLGQNTLQHYLSLAEISCKFAYRARNSKFGATVVTLYAESNIMWMDTQAPMECLLFYKILYKPKVMWKSPYPVSILGVINTI